MTTPPGTLVLALVVLSAFAVACVGLAVAGPMPDAMQMALMRHSIAETPLVRVRGKFGTQLSYRPLLDSSGVRLAQLLGGRRSAMRITVANAGQIEPIPWHEISSLQTDRAGSAGKSTLIGGVIGLAVGVAVVLSTLQIYPFAPDQTERANGVLLASVGAGVGLGFLVGRHGQRRTIYPLPSNGRR